MINKIIKDIPNVKFPFNPEIIAHGIITAPDPKIGKASTKAIPKAINSGNPTSNPAKCIIYNPTSDIAKEIAISINCDFKYPPKVFVISFRFTYIFFTHVSGK